MYTGYFTVTCDLGIYGLWYASINSYIVVALIVSFHSFCSSYNQCIKMLQITMFSWYTVYFDIRGLPLDQFCISNYYMVSRWELPIVKYFLWTDIGRFKKWVKEKAKQYSVHGYLIMKKKFRLEWYFHVIEKTWVWNYDGFTVNEPSLIFIVLMNWVLSINANKKRNLSYIIDDIMKIPWDKILCKLPHWILTMINKLVHEMSFLLLTMSYGKKYIITTDLYLAIYLFLSPHGALDIPLCKSIYINFRKYRSYFLKWIE